LRLAPHLRARAQEDDQHPARAVREPHRRQPIYHIGFDERPEWAYAQEPLVPLKGYPGVVWNRSKKKRSDEPLI